MFFRPPTGIRHDRPRRFMSDTTTRWSATTEDLCHSKTPRRNDSMCAVRQRRILRVIRSGTRLRKGCVLSPLLFNVFVAAVLIDVLQRFSSEPVSRRFRASEGGTDYTETQNRASKSQANCVGHSLYGHAYSESKDQPGKVANPARGQLNRENEYFPVRVRA